MAKGPTVTTIASGYYSTTALNNNFSNIDNAFENTLSLDGSTPNQMTADFDVNNNNILNVSSLQADGITLNGVGITPTSVAATPAASAISITDAGGYYAATEVESALQEVQADLAVTNANISTNYQPLDSLLTTLSGTSITGVSGADLDLVTGTAGTSGNVATWNADGDIVDGGYAPGAMVFIESQDAAGGTTLEFTGFDATKYDSYVFHISNVINGGAGGAFEAPLSVRTSSDGGSTWDGGASDYSYAYATWTFEVSPTSATSGDDASSRIDLSSSVGGSAGEDGISGTLTVYGPHLAKKTAMSFDGVYIDTSGVERMVKSGGMRLSSADVDAIQFNYIGVGANFGSGTITMYGLRNS